MLKSFLLIGDKYTSEISQSNKQIRRRFVHWKEFIDEFWIKLKSFSVK